ncbi:LytTR family transcriptional regulator DNA-binding domain-containing protein [Fulvivirgaceae bacterium BMA12]|uniref:LytTR family transcriptional regulator DNA-binding domain-containing protein n=1 Tax=Agaribacillus aureus TaxID=3051825 RepID=A0ABT8LCM5_9BACT|nr:LytTR family transcriptional regulator DNA-binding domain-containing protein [Fulvivirgaceae bacterium BMA12]
MNILYPYCDSSKASPLFELMEEIISDLAFPSIRLQRVKFDGYPFKIQPNIAIVGVEDEESYWHSLNFLNYIVKDGKLPFIYLVTIKSNFSWEIVKRYNPDHFLLPPYSHKILRQTIRNFLLKYYENTRQNQTPSENKKVWLSVKRGVYQSVVINTIKYIEAEDHYIRIHCDSQTIPLIKATMKGFFEQYLAQQGNFYMLNRSCIINRDKVTKIENNKLFIQNLALSIPKDKRNQVLDFVGIEN